MDKTIRGLCYELYKNDWMRRISAERKADALKNWYQETPIWNRTVYPPSSYIEENGYDGEYYVCFEEFLEAEYQDSDYIKSLLDNEQLYTEYQEDLTFECSCDLANIADSLELSSGTIIAEMMIAGKKCHIEVVGDVSIEFEGNIYHDAKDYPERLRELIHTTDIYTDEDTSINLNNWFEVFYKGTGEVINCEYMDSDELKEELLTYAKEVIEREAA